MHFRGFLPRRCAAPSGAALPWPGGAGRLYRRAPGLREPQAGPVGGHPQAGCRDPEPPAALRLRDARRRGELLLQFRLHAVLPQARDGPGFRAGRRGPLQPRRHQPGASLRQGRALYGGLQPPVHPDRHGHAVGVAADRVPDGAVRLQQRPGRQFRDGRAAADRRERRLPPPALRPGAQGLGVLAAAPPGRADVGGAPGGGRQPGAGADVPRRRRSTPTRSTPTIARSSPSGSTARRSGWAG